MALFKFGKNILSNAFKYTPKHNISTTAAVRIKEIKSELTDKCLEISAEYKPSPREGLLMNDVTTPGKKFCPKCTLGLDIMHTDVLILSQYLRSDGGMLPRRITGLCNVQQKYIGSLVRMAQKAGLMSNIAPENSKKDPTKRKDHKKFNTYFDETTISYRRKPVVEKC